MPIFFSNPFTYIFTRLFLSTKKVAISKGGGGEKSARRVNSGSGILLTIPHKVLSWG